MACRSDFICIVCIELDVCGNVFSQGPCTASGDECRNTWETCKDRCNFTCDTKKVYFSTCAAPAHFPFNAYPIIDSQSISRIVVKPAVGQSFSTRPYVSMTLNDVADNDLELNPYADITIYCAQKVPGSLLGRLFSANKWFDGRVATLYTGYCSQDFSELKAEKFVIESFTGKPSRNSGTATLTLQDPLVLATDATCPPTTEYTVATLNNGTAYNVSLSLGIELTKDEPDLLYGQFILGQNLLVGEDEQDAMLAQVQYVCVGSEILLVESCFNESFPVGWNFKLTGRAQCGSELADHSAGDSLYPALHMRSMHIVDIIRCLLVQCANMNDVLVNCCIDPGEGIINEDSFEDYRCKNPLQYGPKDMFFCKPESVKKHINELEVLFGFQLYTEQETGTVKIRGQQPINGTPEYLLQGCRLEKIAISYLDNFQKLSVIHTPIDCSKSVSGENSKTLDVFTTDDAIRRTCARHESRKVNHKVIQTSWIDESNAFILRTQGYRFIRRHRQALRFLQITGGPDLIEDLEQDQAIRIDHGCLQNPDGSNDTDTIWEVQALIPGKKESKICVMEQPYKGYTQVCIDCTAQIQPPTPYCDTDCSELY